MDVKLSTPYDSNALLLIAHKWRNQPTTAVVRQNTPSSRHTPAASKTAQIVQRTILSDTPMYCPAEINQPMRGTSALPTPTIASVKSRVTKLPGCDANIWRQSACAVMQ